MLVIQIPERRQGDDVTVNYLSDGPTEAIVGATTIKQRRRALAEVLAAALRRFPSNQRQIRRLAISDPAFRSLCEDLGAAEAVLTSSDSRSVSAERREEYAALVAELTGEIEAALRASVP